MMSSSEALKASAMLFVPRSVTFTASSPCWWRSPLGGSRNEIGRRRQRYAAEKCSRIPRDVEQHELLAERGGGTAGRRDRVEHIDRHRRDAAEIDDHDRDV